MRAMARRDPLRPRRPPCSALCGRWRAWPPPASHVYSHVTIAKEVLLFVVVGRAEPTLSCSAWLDFQRLSRSLDALCGFGRAIPECKSRYARLGLGSSLDATRGQQQPRRRRPWICGGRQHGSWHRCECSERQCPSQQCAAPVTLLGHGHAYGTHRARPVAVSIHDVPQRRTIGLVSSSCLIDDAPYASPSRHVPSSRSRCAFRSPYAS